MTETSPVPLTPADRRLLAALQEDGRATSAALAERVGMEPSPSGAGCARWRRPA